MCFWTCVSYECFCWQVGVRTQVLGMSMLPWTQSSILDLAIGWPFLWPILIPISSWSWSSIASWSFFLMFIQMLIVDPTPIQVIHDPSKMVATDGLLMIAVTGKAQEDGYTWVSEILSCTLKHHHHHHGMGTREHRTLKRSWAPSSSTINISSARCGLKTCGKS